MDPIKLRRSAKKTTKKAITSTKDDSSSYGITEKLKTRTSSDENKGTLKSSFSVSFSSPPTRTTQSNVSTVNQNNQENQTPSPPSALRDLRNALRGRPVEGLSPFQSPRAKEGSQRELQQSLGKETDETPANKQEDSSPPPITPYSGLLAGELDMNPDDSLLVVSPTPLKPTRLAALRSKRRSLLGATKLSGKAQRLRIEPASQSETVKIDGGMGKSSKTLAVRTTKVSSLESKASGLIHGKTSPVVHQTKNGNPTHSISDASVSDSRGMQRALSTKPKDKEDRSLAKTDGTRDIRSSLNLGALKTVAPMANTKPVNDKTTSMESSAALEPLPIPQSLDGTKGTRGSTKLTLKQPLENKTIQGEKKSVTVSFQAVLETKKSVTASFQDAQPDCPVSTSPSGAVCVDFTNMFRDPNSSKNRNLHTLHASEKASTRERKEAEMVEADVPPQDWAAKQCSAFQEWLNYALEPSEDSDEEKDSSDKAGFRELVLQQRMASVRMRSKKLWQSTGMDAIRDKVRSEIRRGRLLLREDKDLHANLNVREQILSLMFSYSIPWLRMGLETVFGEAIDPHVRQKHSPVKLSNGTALYKSPKKKFNRMEFALREFIINRVLSDKAVLSKYTKRLCKVPSGKFGANYQAELRSLVLYRLLVLFFFLDRAKTENILDKVPALFNSDAEVKSSKDVLLYFCRNFLSQEGDFIKHLSRMRLTVSYRQEPVDEITFPVTNLAIDLRDGVRLTRLVEILTHAPIKSLLHGLRLPAVSRLQKLHNVGFFLDTLRKSGVSIGNDVMPHQIVDSHREIVLGVLWAIITRFCLGRVADEQKLMNEICRIKRSRGTKTGIEKPSGDFENRIRLLLIEWCTTVCAEFGVRVDNLTTDFADGVVVCLLLHFYLPHLVRLTEIRRTSRTTSFMNASKGSDDIIRRNERWNSEFASKKLYMLGGIGRMIPITDSSNLPDPKAMLLCLVYIFSRILSCSNELRASLVIQRFVRERQRVALMKRKMEAARLIMSKWLEHKEQYYSNQRSKYGVAIRTIELFFAERKHRIEEVRKRRLMWEEIKRKIILLQSHVRAIIARKNVRMLMHQHMVCTTLQCWWRRMKATSILLTLRVNRNAARKIQRAYRWSKENHRSKNLAAIVIQSRWRSFCGQVQYQIDIMDIVDVQRCARRMLALRSFNDARASAIKLQSTFRRIHGRTSFCRMRSASFIIQKTWRRFHAQQIFSIVCKGVISLQSHYRSHITSRTYGKMRTGLISLQSEVRKHLQRCAFLDSIRCVCKCQAIARALIAQNEAARRKNAIVSMQAFNRGYQARHRLKAALNASVVMQSMWRRSLARSKFTVAVWAALEIQKTTRRFLAFNRFQNYQRSAITIQKRLRMLFATSKLEALRYERAQLEKASATLLQSSYRAYTRRRELKVMRSSAILVQALTRGFLARSTYELDRANICTVQTVARMWLSKRKASGIRASALIVQGFCRMVLASKTADNLRTLVRSAIRLQCFIRTKKAKTVYNERFQERLERERRAQAASQIQRKARDFLHRYRAARKIQKTWRCYSVHIDFMLSVLSSIQIQSAIRRKIAILQARTRSNAVNILQRFSRKVVRKIQGATLIQRCIRGYFVRLQLEVQDYAATEIQRVWRGYTGNMIYMNAVVSAVMIQSIVRSKQAKQHVETLRIKRYALIFMRERACARIQCLFRVYMEQRRLEIGAIVIQRNWRNLRSRREFLHLRKQIMSIQARFRSRVTRKRRPRKVAKVAERIQKANAKAARDPSQTLGARTGSALALLSKSARLETIRVAVKSLEVATKYSQACCRAFTRSGASEILFICVRSCNRSMPHMELVQSILRTMANVTRYKEFRQSIATPTGVEVFLDLVQMFRDKDVLFHLAVRLLEIALVENEQLKDLCASHENIKRLKTLVALSKRKAVLLTPPAAHSRGKNSRDRAYEMTDAVKGIRALHRIIQMVDNNE